MDNTFRDFLDYYMSVWKASSLIDLKKIISTDFKAREISRGEIVDFGYEESILGWEQGFNFVKENNAEWILNEISIFPLREDERLVVLAASMVIDDKNLDTANLFFQTFKKNSHHEWKLVRSYIEAGVPNANISEMRFS
ncbi:flavoprotein [Salinibacillus xinjiangensis]|uniref:Flavoprotein n=1 Tax=Salinibacillus xinjiangensis TaxID=1229268 RepID=A0A6G1X578_9BACI|nr:flavoprotein [Salinibacillus xinjiangensis]MRG86079.1 flavoprotein [Salinibacillus xinjiangensis]